VQSQQAAQKLSPLTTQNWIGLFWLRLQSLILSPVSRFISLSDAEGREKHNTLEQHQHQMCICFSTLSLQCHPKQLKTQDGMATALEAPRLQWPPFALSHESRAS